MSSPLTAASPQLAASPGVRVLWVTRRYWPHGAGEHPQAAASVALTQALAAMGMHIEVVTPRYGAHWSQEFQCDRVRVHRILAAPKGDWSTQRYVRYLGNWMAEQSHRFDWIVCEGIHDDVRSVAVAIEHARRDPNRGSRPPTRGVVLCDGWGGDGDDVTCRQARSGKRCLQAVADLEWVVTRHSGVERSLVASGISPERLRRISPGFARPTRVSLDQRLLSRRSLAGINRDLITDADDHVLLWCGRMSGSPDYEGGLGGVVGSARLLCGRYPNLKIWMLGDGPLRDWVHTELKAEGVRDVVAIPGTFADMSDIWNAVEGVVVTDEDQLRYTLPAAIAHALPTIVADRAPLRAWMNDKFDADRVDSVAWYDDGKPGAFRKTFRSVWENLPAANDLAWETAMDAARRFNAGEELRQWTSVLSPVTWNTST
ncbi:glycosyltransferase family protein [Allorhodopirellula solitaria]|uniref:Glycosyl transferases group 1 n=1 Tax=Allorhodopirellula solitaria TaxID=2527987 RepID=A0A5C5XU83_9BACT|nr:glycosyltransferase family 1 protein [Allorhodopirellula solitaria]TWT66119.1 hypothetical protein CA85_29830 [Allorhodopirellula solitaria]